MNEAMRSPAADLDAAMALGGALNARARRSRVLGTFVIEIPTKATIRALALAGFDFVILDLEHSAYGVAALPALISEAHLLGLTALVRISSHDAGLVTKVLDAGANGIMAPHVADAGEARAIVAAARYAPLGARGLAPMIGLADLPRPQTELDRDIVVISQIEGREALENSAAISAVPGVSGIFVGPYDLSQALGVPGDVEHPTVIEAAERVARQASGGGFLGVYVNDPRRSAAWTARGFLFQCLSLDSRMLLAGARAVMEAAGP